MLSSTWHHHLLFHILLKGNFSDLLICQVNHLDCHVLECRTYFIPLWHGLRNRLCWESNVLWGEEVRLEFPLFLFHIEGAWVLAVCLIESIDVYSTESLLSSVILPCQRSSRSTSSVRSHPNCLRTGECSCGCLQSSEKCIGLACGDLGRREVACKGKKPWSF